MNENLVLLKNCSEKLRNIKSEEAAENHHILSGQIKDTESKM